MTLQSVSLFSWVDWRFCHIAARSWKLILAKSLEDGMLDFGASLFSTDRGTVRDRWRIRE